VARPALRMCSTRLVDVPCSGGHFSGSATRDLRGHADLSAGPDRCTSRGTCEPFDLEARRRSRTSVTVRMPVRAIPEILCPQLLSMATPCLPILKSAVQLEDCDKW